MSLHRDHIKITKTINMDYKEYERDYIDITWRLHIYYMEITGILHGYYMEITWRIQGDYKEIRKRILGE